MGWILQGGHRSIIKASVNFQVSPVSKTNAGEGDARSGIHGVLLSSATTPAHQRNQLFICSKDSIWDLCSAPSLWQGPGERASMLVVAGFTGDLPHSTQEEIATIPTTSVRNL